MSTPRGIAGVHFELLEWFLTMHNLTELE
jgi:hypothetical protein